MAWNTDREISQAYRTCLLRMGYGETSGLASSRCCDGHTFPGSVYVSQNGASVGLMTGVVVGLITGLGMTTFFLWRCFELTTIDAQVRVILCHLRGHVW